MRGACIASLPFYASSRRAPLFIIYLLLDLYSAFLPESLRPIKDYTSKIKLKMVKVGNQIGIENLRDNG